MVGVGDGGADSGDGRIGWLQLGVDGGGSSLGTGRGW